MDLESHVRDAANPEDALQIIASQFGAVTATLHRVEGGELHLVAARGLPEPVRVLTARIPFGKGMAGICAERREAVTVCNVQSDESGVVRPGAKLTGVEGAIVVPVLDGGGVLLGTLGIGKPTAHDYSPDEIATLEGVARVLAASLPRG